MQINSIKNPKIVSKITIIMLALGMLGVILASIGIGIYLETLSHEVAQANQEVAYMRVPVLIISEIIVALFVLACILSFIILVNFWLNRIFSKVSSIVLKIMSLCFILIIVMGIILIVYTQANVKGSITNLYVKFGIFISIVASCIFYLIAHLIDQGNKYKVENELTI